MNWTEGKLPVKGILTIIGGFLVHITLGTQLTYGNTNPYVISYIRNCSSPSDLENIDGVWVQACMLIGTGISMFVGGVIEVKLGPRLATLIGAWFLSLGVLLTYFTIKTSFITTVLTYGVMFGLGCGASYAVPVGAAMRWFPRYRGFVGGIVFLGFGVGSVIFNQIITVYVNPDNFSPDIENDDDEESYFGQAKVLDRVPTLFLILGGTYAALQLIGCVLISNPPPDPQSLKSEVPTKESYTLHKNNSQDTVWTTSSSTVTLTSTTTSSTTVPSDSNDNTDKPTAQETTPEEEQKETEVDTVEVPPLQMVKTRMFWCLWFMFLLGGLGGVFLASQYKAYGQSFISDDRYFSIVGSCASAFNAVAGMIWGWLADRFTFKKTMQIALVIFSTLAYTLSSAEDSGQGYFFVWVCLVFFCNSGLYALMPSACGRLFGNKYMGLNYGLLYSSQILTAAASAFLAQLLIDQIGYHGLFNMIGGALTLALLIAISIQPTSPDGKPV